MFRQIAATFVIVLLFVASQFSQAKADDSRTFVGQRGVAFVEAMNNGSDEALLAFVNANIAGPPQPDKAAALVARLQEIRAERGELLDANYRIISNGRALFVTVRSEKTGVWESFQFLIDQEYEGRLTLAFISIATEPVSLPAGSILDAGVHDWIRQRIAALASSQPFYGVVMIAKDGETVFAEAAGFADAESGKANTVDTRFNTASGAKMFTAVAVLKLVEDGALTLETPVVSIVPELAASGYGEDITIRHLLSHTSGIPEYWDETFDQVRAETVEPEQFLPHILRQTAKEPLGTFSYSNSNFALLSIIIERTTGKDFYDVVRATVFEPAGMSQTGYPLSSNGWICDTCARGYMAVMEAGAVAIGRHDPAPQGGRGSGAGGASVTAADMVRFFEALEDGKLLKPETAALMTSPVAAMSESGSQHYGLGVIISTLGGMTGYGHGGMAPGTQFFSEHYAETGITIIIASNYDTIAGYELNAAISEIIRGTR